ncbi:hypothetical protein [Candidatus Lokiarchaeum ossiferum]|uniref:hypothetical protein n=1 Tax=Candidatus Lokiarchaeum ossiferum TaxID=2951803 RepID=UPI00352FEC57
MNQPSYLLMEYFGLNFEDRKLDRNPVVRALITDASNKSHFLLGVLDRVSMDEFPFYLEIFPI